MQFSIFPVLAFAAFASAQTTNLTAALASSPQLSNLTGLLSAYPGVAAGLAGATNVTILAPSNAAFANLDNDQLLFALTNYDNSTIQSFINYHVLNGTYNSSQITDTPSFVPTHLTDPTFANVTGGQRVEAINANGNVTFYSGLLSNSSVSQANIVFDGGIIHVIDTFLVPPVNISTTAVALGLSSAAGALEQATLVAPLDVATDVTAFVPSNEAFEAIGSALANATISELTSILEYHVVNGTVAYSTDVVNETVPTLQGSNLTLTVEGGSVFVNQAKVIIPNILVANGVVHVIDSVLNPNASSISPNPSPSATASAAFSGATSISNAPFTSGIPVPTATIAIPSAATAATGAGTTSSGGAGSGTSSPSTAGAAKVTEMAMGAMGAGALFAGAWIGF